MPREFTYPQDLKLAEQKRFDSGQRIKEDLEGQFPLTLKLHIPTSGELKVKFNHCRDWAQAWDDLKDKLNLEYTTISTTLHSQTLPCAVTFKTIEELAAFTGRTPLLNHFKDCCKICESRLPELLPFIKSHPKFAFDYHDIMDRAVSVCLYLLKYPRPNIYLRELDLPGVDTKFLERHNNKNERGFPGPVGQLLDCVLPPEAIDENFWAHDNFVRRYGFKPKPEFIRFHLLDKSNPENERWNDLTDVQVDKDSFAGLSFAVDNVVICENEVSYLALPALRSSLAIFGKGYGFSGWESFNCLKGRRIIYWGDLDVDGFSILNQLRAQLPGEDLVSALMDEETIKDFTELAVKDRCNYLAEEREFHYLSPAELQAYQALITDKYGTNLRIEQERLPYSRIKQEIEKRLR